MKFRQKNFLITLIIFLFFLNLCCLLLAFYTQTKAISSDMELCFAEFSIIKKAFEKDSEGTGEIGKTIIMNSYGKYYNEKKVYLSLASSSKEFYNTISSNVTIPDIGGCSTQRINGIRYFVISDIVDDDLVLSYAKDVSYLDDQFREMSIIFVISSILASCLLSLILFIVLKQLSAPLENLTIVTEHIAHGDYSARAKTYGKDEISTLADNINTMAEKVEQQLESLKNNAELKQLMLDNIAHEMRTPLTSIRGYADYISNSRIEEDERITASNYIINEAERLEAISEKLLDEAFIRENEIDVIPTNIKKLVLSTQQMFLNRINEKDINLFINVDDDIIYCDPTLISVVLSNLVDNAIKACKNGGQILIESRKTKEHFILSIKDNGIGIPSEQIKHITEPFYRTDKSRSRSEGGTGLGLSLCEKIIKAHKSDLIFESKVGVGTAAIINFTKNLQLINNDNIS